MKISARTVADVLVVDMTGRLDTSTSGQASDDLVEMVKSCGKVVLKLDQLEYVSSAGLRVLLLAAKLVEASDGEMKICHPNGSVKEVMETSGFHSLLRMYDTEKDALAAFVEESR